MSEEDEKYTKEFEYVPIEQEIINKIKQCDDFHNRCDCLLEHSECTYLIEYIEALEKTVFGGETMTLEEKYTKVFDYFGYENQRRKLNEEVQELNDEILLYEKGEGDIKNVITEMADVCNIIREFMFAYGISQEEITSSMDDKMDRTIERINSNYYKKEGGDIRT